MITDEVMGMFELCNDLLFGKIPEERYRYYVEESLRLGREAAERLLAAAQPPHTPYQPAAHQLQSQPPASGDILRWYEKAGIEILYQEASGENYGISFRAQSEYGRDGSAKVLIYGQSIAKLAECSRRLSLWEAEERQEPDTSPWGPGADSSIPGVGGISGIGTQEALKVHLAHEFFHYLEYHSGEIKDDETMVYYDHGFVSDYLEQVRLWKLFGRKRQAGILRCSEIAAHAFAKRMTGLEVLPNYYDYIYLIAEGKLSREDFKKRAGQLKEQLG